jgi:hypothetical protein
MARAVRRWGVPAALIGGGIAILFLGRHLLGGWPAGIVGMFIAGTGVARAPWPR